ncbi:zinc finger protein Pegasus-like [Ostrea edulis]|uniref:zinc finger protein Pegasus-like n=2 Tax=Ostrea edulis TaxID=37623 RepID=UPI002094F090|nr:zinc finger protein Pegasus-like [Ostrea edulis]
MPKTKTTVRKGRKCPLCPLRFYTDEEMAKHITSCSKALIYCDHCDFSSLTSRNIKRHMKRKHDLVDDREQMDGGIDSEDLGNVDSDEESWLGQDPGSLVEVLPVVADEHEKEDVDHEPGPSIKRSLREEAGKIVEIGRVVRKPTRPMPIHTPHRELVTATVPDKSISDDLLPDMGDSKLEKYKDAQCQTDPLYYTESTVITTRWVEDGKTMKKVEKKKLI